MLQNGGLPDDITAGEAVAAGRGAARRGAAGRRGAAPGRGRRRRRRSGRTALGRAEAAGAVRRRPRRATPTCWCSTSRRSRWTCRPAGSSGGDARYTARAHGPVRDPLPRRGRGVRRPRGADARGPGGRRRQRRAGAGAGRRSGGVATSPGRPRGAGGAAGGVAGVRVEAVAHPPDLRRLRRRPLRALLAAGPRPPTSRSSRTASRTRSSAHHGQRRADMRDAAVRGAAAAPLARVPDLHGRASRWSSS